MCNFYSNQYSNRENERATRLVDYRETIILHPSDVIYLPSYEDLNVSLFIPNDTVKCSQIQNNILSIIWKERINWLKDGFRAEVLSPNQSWQESLIEVIINIDLAFKPDNSINIRRTREFSTLSQLNLLNPDDVISVSQDISNKRLIPSETFRASQLQDNICSDMLNQLKPLKTLYEGFNAEVLLPNHSWQKGTVEVEIECLLSFKVDTELGDDNRVDGMISQSESPI